MAADMRSSLVLHQKRLVAAVGRSYSTESSISLVHGNHPTNLMFDLPASCTDRSPVWKIPLNNFDPASAMGSDSVLELSVL